MATLKRIVGRGASPGFYLDIFNYLEGRSKELNLEGREEIPNLVLFEISVSSVYWDSFRQVTAQGLTWDNERMTIRGTLNSFKRSYVADKDIYLGTVCKYLAQYFVSYMPKHTEYMWMKAVHRDVTILDKIMKEDYSLFEVDPSLSGMTPCKSVADKFILIPKDKEQIFIQKVVREGEQLQLDIFS